MSEIGVWQITPTETLKVETDARTLDEITQHLPEGYYSTFRTYDGGRRVLGLSGHLRRLYEPVSMPEVDEPLLRRRLSVLLDTYRPGEARVRAVMAKNGQVYLALMPLSPLPRQVYEAGVRVETTELQRQHPSLKSTSFIHRSDSERRHLAEEGIFEALLVRDGEILEGMTSNFFYVNRSPRHVLGTAGHGILFGITRETVLAIAQGRGITIQYQPLRLDLLETIEEAFMTSSTRGVVPVIQVDEITIGEGIPGPMTKELMADYDAYVIEKAEKI